MLYAFLCYNNEAAVMSWTPEEDSAVMAKLDVVHQRLLNEGRLGPSMRLMPTSAATTLIKEKDVILDGPYAETKEALLGLYILDCDSLDQAHSIARELGVANPGGAYEVRPLRLYLQGADVSKAAP
ncbi:RNA polymerase sigma-70 factor [alpha proteobacterium U9-1i]|nr:RNA polymerase sigma-70 factor [alpha proteobacterium U9-1i]